MRYVSNHTSAEQFITARKEFNGSSMKGRTRPTGEVGRLPGAWRSFYYATVNDIDFIVYSWSTPIAWHLTTGAWVVPSVSYSGYSSRHLTLAFSAIRKETTIYNRIEGDIYYHDYELMDSYKAYLETGKARLLHNRRKYDYVTIRGLNTGDYVYSPDAGRWLCVYAKVQRRGVFGRKYWVAICYAKDGATVTVYLGETGERFGRLR